MTNWKLQAYRRLLAGYLACAFYLWASGAWKPSLDRCPAAPPARSPTPGGTTVQSHAWRHHPQEAIPDGGNPKVVYWTFTDYQPYQPSQRPRLFVHSLWAVTVQTLCTVARWAERMQRSTYSAAIPPGSLWSLLWTWLNHKFVSDRCGVCIGGIGLLWQSSPIHHPLL